MLIYDFISFNCIQMAVIPEPDHRRGLRLIHIHNHSMGLPRLITTYAYPASQTSRPGVSAVKGNNMNRAVAEMDDFLREVLPPYGPLPRKS